MKTHAFLIAAPQSGSGKTTVALAVMAAFKRRGMTVAPFKCGPDFIDPGYHRLATGRPSVNLDGWMCPETFVADTFRLQGKGADVAVIEGAMGLFDGIGHASMEGSSAQVAAICGVPVVLVVNARGMAASAAALVKGFAGYDERVRIAGVIFNNVGSESHGELLRRSLAAALPELTVFGCIPRDDSLGIPSRHLGLVTAEDNPLSPDYLERLAVLAENRLDLGGLADIQVLPGPPVPKAGTSRDAATGGMPPVRIAVARDAAFCFVYEDNLRLLREAGAEIVPFSPLAEARLPADIHGIYLPGGYPELHAGRLAANGAMKAAVRDAVEAGMPVYAECGGFIYLTRGMEAGEGQPAVDFVGVFPVRARMLPKRKALGYRQVECAAHSGAVAAGGSARGHEFHYSEVGTMPDRIERCYRVSRQGRELGREGYRYKNCLASYIHLHFGSNGGIAPAFADACRKFEVSPNS
ncbi:cobyrinate a,c-diamide synthase [Oryzomonas sagensis]|uniref:Cobyrinate a,c-diamide synthase n=1 Tax=Oryzomonas sagensis TaxID=2603857 RepID=A0ABQ6TU00_9BACT|nr:cobyrinate a,c-diamide synthase [Oryzomonas sagensis]KAB0672207.1 cobyrinate a,c-diamide synthase [Oryzomonas sagensis]